MTTPEWFTSIDARSAAMLLLIAKVTLLLAGGALAAACLRLHSAAARHLAWTLALASALIVPLAAFLAPAVPVSVPASAAWRAVLVAAPQSVAGSQMIAPAFGEHADAATRDVQAAAPAPTSRRPAAFAPFALLALVWLAGAVVVLLRAAIGHVRLLQLERRARRLEGAAWRPLVAEALARSGVARRVRFARSDAVATPMTWGGWRPVVVVPDAAEQWPDQRRRVALQHELAHVARGDYLAQLVATLACAVYWFHPLAWLAARRLRLESEHACDDRVLQFGMDAPDYASQLLDVARASRALRLEGQVAVCMARPSSFEGRLLALLDDSRPRRGLAARTCAVVAAVLALALIPYAGLRPRLAAAGTDRTPSPVAGAAAPAPTTSSTTDAGATENATMPPSELLAARQSDPSSQTPHDRHEHTLTARPGEALSLDLETGGSIDLRGWDENRVVVRSTLGGRDWEHTRLTFEREGRAVVLRAWHEDKGSSSTSHHFEIRVPRRFDLRMRSAGGGLHIVDLEGTMRGQTGGGDLELERVSGDVQLATGGGDIRVTDANASGWVSTGGGSVWMSRVRGGLRGNSGSGPVVQADAESGDADAPSGDLSDLTLEDSRIRSDAVAAKRRGRLDIQKAGGGIDLDEVPNGASVTTGGGDIRIGSGAGIVDAHTGGGDIQIGPIAGSVKASTGAGRVEVTIASARGSEQNVEVSSGYGPVVIVLPADLDARVEIETAFTRGKPATQIESDFEMSRDAISDWEHGYGSPRRFVRAHTTLGRGRGLVQVKTVNGDVEVRRGR